jgi:hypothetical protein
LLPFESEHGNVLEQCTWQNNSATLQGTTIFYNKKHVLISKTPQVRKKAISFYYVLGAGKPAPAVPSDQGFYQLLWDDLDRSKRSLKRILAPSQAKPAAPPNKKAKASSSLPEPPSNLPLSPPSPPEPFKEANRMIQEAWKVVFPSLRFPLEWIAGCPQLAKKKASETSS